jgi:hypothetical protein
MSVAIKIKPTETDVLNDALALVIELAFQNVIDRLDNPREYRRQMAAVHLVQQTFGVGDIA